MGSYSGTTTVSRALAFHTDCRRYKVRHVVSVQQRCLIGRAGGAPERGGLLVREPPGPGHGHREHADYVRAARAVGVQRIVRSTQNTLETLGLLSKRDELSHSPELNCARPGSVQRRRHNFWSLAGERIFNSQGIDNIVVVIARTPLRVASLRSSLGRSIMPWKVLRAVVLRSGPGDHPHCGYQRRPHGPAAWRARVLRAGLPSTMRRCPAVSEGRWAPDDVSRRSS